MKIDKIREAYCLVKGNKETAKNAIYDASHGTKVVYVDGVKYIGADH